LLLAKSLLNDLNDRAATTSEKMRCKHLGTVAQSELRSPQVRLKAKDMGELRMHRVALAQSLLDEQAVITDALQAHQYACETFDC
jgi:hypothetical protein